MQMHVYEYEEYNFWNRPLTECVDVTDQYFRCLTQVFDFQRPLLVAVFEQFRWEIV